MTLVSFGREFDPVRALLELQSEIDRFRTRPPTWNLGPSGGGVFPAVNVFGDREGIVVRVEVPGVKPDTLGIEMEGRTLNTSRERAREEDRKGSYHRRERRFGRFARSFQLPEDLDGSKAAADYKNGVLTIRVPKHAEARPRQIPIKPA